MQTNIASVPSTMESIEERVVQKLLLAGYCDPRKDEDHVKGLVFKSANGKKYRKFLTAFAYILPGKIKKSQVRDEDYNKAYCDEQLKPLIKKEGLKYVPHIDKFNQLESGHNRLPVLMGLFPGKELPFLTTSQPYEVLSDGSFKIAGNVKFKNLVSKIKVNPSPKSNPYDMKGAAQHVRDLFIADPTFEGRNPSGEWFEDTDDVFNSIMDWLHPNQFLSKGTRTQIRNLAGRDQSVIKTLEFPDWTHAATASGWPSGVKPGKKKPSRMGFTEWFDKADNCHVTIVSTNGKKLKEKVLLELTELYLGSGFSGISGVKILLKIDKPKSNPLALNKQREDFVAQHVDALNKKLKAKKWPQIKEVRCLKQLNHPSDTGAHYKQGPSGVLFKK